MKRVLFILPAVVATGILVSAPADAGCGDPPAPGVDWSGCVKANADLRGADLQDADLTGANLAGADLIGANVKNTALVDVDLQGANLTGAMLRQARHVRVNFEGADLTGVCGEALSTVQAEHQGSSFRLHTPGAVAVGEREYGIDTEPVSLPKGSR